MRHSINSIRIMVIIFMFACGSYGWAGGPAAATPAPAATATTSTGIGSAVEGGMAMGAVSAMTSGNISGAATMVGGVALTSAVESQSAYNPLAHTCHSGYGWACPLAAMALTAEISSLINAAKSKGTASDVSGGSNCSDPSSPFCSSGGPQSNTLNPTNNMGTSGNLTPDGGPSLPAAQSALNALNNQGYSFNPNTGMVTTPNGTYPSGAFANGQTMANAGIIPQSEVPTVDKTLKGLLDKYTVSAMAIKGGGGGGGGNNTQVQFYNPNAGLFGKRRVTASAQTAGLTRQLANGEVIGSATDDIFAMIHRQYMKQTKLGEFIQK